MSTQERLNISDLMCHLLILMPLLDSTSSCWMVNIPDTPVYAESSKHLKNINVTVNFLKKLMAHYIKELADENHGFFDPEYIMSNLFIFLMMNV